MLSRRTKRRFAEATTKIPGYVHPESLEGRRERYTSTTAATLAARARIKLKPEDFARDSSTAEGNRRVFVQRATQEGGFKAISRRFKEEDPSSVQRVREVATTSMLEFVTPHLTAVSEDFARFAGRYGLGPLDFDEKTDVAGKLLTPDAALDTLEDRWVQHIDRYGDPNRVPRELGALASRVMQSTMYIELAHRETVLAEALGAGVNDR